jgi:putative ABC transport system ATP-binding protein
LCCSFVYNVECRRAEAGIDVQRARRAPRRDSPGKPLIRMTTATPNEEGTIRTVKVCRHHTMGTSVIRAVDGISLSVEAGDFVALLGSSGSGKSSLLNLIAGLDRPTSGDVQVDGRSLARMSSEELAHFRRHRVGIVFQAFNLVPSMTVAENVELPLRLAETDRRERAGRVRQALDQVRLSQRLAHRPGELSGGEQQRVALARALVNSPRILLADEPTGNLDSHTGMEIMDLLADCNRRLGMTVLLVTHERALAERHAGRMLFLADGKLVADEPNAAHDDGVEGR